jgi:hypothetical protein
MTYWRLRRGNTPMVGPVNTERIIRGIEAGRIPFDAEVQRVGDETWAHIGEIPEFSAAYVTSGSSEPPTRIVGASEVPPADFDEGSTRIMSPGALRPPSLPRQVGALPHPPKPPRLAKAPASRTTARAIPRAPRAISPAHGPHPTPTDRPADSPSGPNEPLASDPPGLDDERTRIMAPAPRAPLAASRSHAAENTRSLQRDNASSAESSADRAGRLPPRPLPPSVSAQDGVSQSDVTQLRDAVEEDEPEDARRPRLAERQQLQSAGSAGVAIVVGAHVPGGDRPGRSTIASTPPAPGLPSVSLHPDHDRTSPALRALRHGPERLIKILVLVIVILSVLLCISIAMHLRG